jgi:hypothetical protein
MLLRPRREFVECELVVPVLAWQESRLRPPHLRPRAAVRPAPAPGLGDIAGKTVDELRALLPPRELRWVPPVPGAIPLRFPAPVIGKAKSTRQNKLRADLKTEVKVRRLQIVRPVTRADCRNVPRPCPFVSCHRHLAYDITDSGSLKTNFPGVALEDMEETCADDVADQGPQTLVRLGRLMNVKTQRADQMVNLALAELAAKLDASGIPWPEQLFGERPSDLDED